MPIDRVGIGPARPCMLMCERTSVSPPRVSASIAHKRSYECTRVPNTYVRTIYTRCLRSVEKYARASEHVHDKYRYSYLRAIALERNSATRTYDSF